MNSYENEIKNAGEKKQNLLTKIDISMMKYLWLANPLSSARKGSIPRFLRNVEILKDFSDNELRILAKYMHSRKFAEGDIVFRQGEIGIGFYFVYSGHVELIYANPSIEHELRNVITFDEYSYFGELALLQENHPRQATAKASQRCELIGVFKPDLDHLIDQHPKIAAKLIQAISIAIADRLYHLAQEASKLQERLQQWEKKHDLE